MKIYATTSYTYGLDKFIGKDIWVLVNHRVTGNSYLAWVRVLSATENEYVVNEAKLCYFDEDEYDIPSTYTGDSVLKNRLMSDTILYDKADTYIVEPLEIASTEELFQSLE